MRRLALVPFGLLLGLLLLEGGLQGAAWFVRVTGRELPSAALSGSVRVLALGDSNTYGLWLERHEAYPQQLEALWSERFGTPQLEVINLGFPATNSSRLVRDLPRLLETFAPDVVIVMVGVNDFWTVPFPIGEAEAERPRAGLLKRHSLVYRLYHLVRRGLDARELEIVMDDPDALEERGRGVHRVRFGDEEFEMSFVRAKPGLQGDREALEKNLLALAAQAEAFGTRLILMTYPTMHSFYRLANPVIARAAEGSKIELIDLTPLFPPECTYEDCPDLFFPDRHPKAPANRMVAEAVVRRLSVR